MDKSKRLMQESILLAADALARNIQIETDEEKIEKYAEAMLKLALAWRTVKER